MEAYTAAIFIAMIVGILFLLYAISTDFGDR